MKRWICLLIVFCLSTLMQTPTFATEDWEYREGGMPSVFVDGLITEVPWQEDYLCVGVNGSRYIIMPTARIYRMYPTASGSVDREFINSTDLKKDDKIQMSINGNRIFEIIVIE